MIYDFPDYRGYLKSYTSALPRGELSRMAEHLNVNNTLLSQVLAGRRDLSLEQAHRLCRYWGFGEDETEYFLTLVLIERAGDVAYREYLIKKRDKMILEARKLANRVQHQKRLKNEDRQIFYSNWIYSAVHLFTTLRTTGVTSEEIGARFHLTKAKVHAVTSFLAQAGLISAHGHYWRVAIESTFVEHGSVHLQNHHRNWRLKAIDRADTIDASELMYTAQVSLSREDFAKIRASLVAAIETSAKTIARSPAEELACFHLDWFWL